jgi:hypothetical protein
MTVATLRARTVARIQRRLPWPRLQMMLIVTLTGAAGFLSSFTLLRAGVETLPLRYVFSVAIAYASFLTLLWCWLRLTHSDIGDVPDVTDLPATGDLTGGGGVSRAPWLGGGRSGGGGATGRFDDSGLAAIHEKGTAVPVDARPNLGFAGVVDSDEVAAVLVALVAIAGAAVATVWVIWTAPVLLAELSLDAAVSTGLYRRLRQVGGDHWLRTAIRRTGPPFLAVTLLFAVAGALIEYLAPDAASMGDLFRQLGAPR